MNGNELSRTSLGETPVLAPENPSDERKELERWAATIAGCLQPAVPVRPLPTGLGTMETCQSVPAGWRPSVDSLTPGAARLDGSSGATGALGSVGHQDADSLQRIQVRVRTEEYGEIALVVERVEAGLRVLLGAVDERAVTALSLESQAVRRALESGGQSVGSLEIVRMNAVGTDLAQPRVAPSNRTRRPHDSPDLGPNLGQRKKKSKRIDVIG